MGQYTDQRRRKAKEVAEMLAKRVPGGIEEIFLFGSVARGDDNESSDIDLMCLSSSLFYTDFFGSDNELSTQVRVLESDLKRERYLVNIALRNYNHFQEKFQQAREKERKGERLSYTERFPLNVIQDRIILYSSEELV